MATRTTPAAPAQLTKAQTALVLLRSARTYLRGAQLPNALQRLEATINSTEGALRHMEHRIQREG